MSFLQLAKDWDESKHPRHPAGAAASQGGEFASDPTVSSIPEIRKFEERMRTARVEHALFMNDLGEKVLQKTDLHPSQVEFTEHNIKQIQSAAAYSDVIMTHNHPRPFPLSWPDLDFGMRMGLKEVRAIAADGTLTALRYKNGRMSSNKLAMREIKDLYHSISFKLIREAGLMQYSTKELYDKFPKEMARIGHESWQQMTRYASSAFEYIYKLGSELAGQPTDKELNAGLAAFAKGWTPEGGYRLIEPWDPDYENEDEDEDEDDPGAWLDGVIKFDPDQPREPAGTPTGGQWKETGSYALDDKDFEIETLPAVWPADYGINVTLTYKKHKGVLEAVQLPEGYLRIRGSILDEDERGKGIGLRMYEKMAEYAKKNNLTLMSDQEVSPEAQRIYGALKRRGYKLEIHPESWVPHRRGGVMLAPMGNPVFTVRKWLQDLLKFDPDQPRAPKGSATGGQWITGALSQSLVNIRAISRTAGTGVVDVSASKGKGGVMLAVDKPAELAERNFVDAFQFATQHLTTKFTPASLVGFMDEIGRRMTAGMTKQLRRTFDSDKYRYTPSKDIDSALHKFAGQLIKRLADVPNAISTVAWAKHRFQRIHPFADAVGRSTELLGAWVALRMGAHIPKLQSVSREEYYRTMEQGVGPFIELHERVMKFDPSQPRHPKGSEEGGRWVDVSIDVKTVKEGVERVSSRFPNFRGKVFGDIIDGKSLRIKGSMVNNNYRGFGLGVRMYAKLADYAHSRGIPLKSDNIVSQFATRIYEALSRRGYTVTKNPAAYLEGEGEEAVWRTTVPTAMVPGGAVFTVTKDGFLKKFDPNQPREPAGTPIGGRWSDTGATVDGVLYTTNSHAAMEAVASNQRVVLRDTSDLYDMVLRMADDSRHFNLGLIRIEGSHLFTGESLDLGRNAMPQLSGKAVPGSIADSWPKRADGNVLGIEDQFERWLEQHGLVVRHEYARASSLKATQQDLNGSKTGQIMRAKKYGTPPLWISADSFVADGHHRWAAAVAVDSRDDALGGIQLPVRRVNADIRRVIELANLFVDEVGILRKIVTAKSLHPGAAWLEGIRENTSEASATDSAVVPETDGSTDFLAGVAAAAEEVAKEWDESKHPRGKTSPESTPGSFTSTGFVSPNVDENVSLTEAMARVDSARTRLLLEADQEIAELYGTQTEEVVGVGAWADGAEQALIVTGSGEFAAFRAHMALSGLLAEQKAVVAFTEDDNGPDTVYNLSSDRPLPEVHNALLAAGVEFHTLQQTAQGVNVFVFAPGTAQELENAVSRAAETLGIVEVIARSGRGEFIGSWDSREEGRIAYEAVLNEYEAAHPPRQGGWQALRDRWRNRLQAVRKNWLETLVKFDPSQPRVAAGVPEGGRWVDLIVETSTTMGDEQLVTVRYPDSRGKVSGIIEGDRLRIRFSRLQEKYHGQGMGLRLYAKLMDYAHSRGLTVVSDETVTLEAQRVYAALKRRGYKVEQHPHARPSSGVSVLYAPAEESVYTVSKFLKWILEKFDPLQGWDELKHPRGKTSPESTPGSFAPAGASSNRLPEDLADLVRGWTQGDFDWTELQHAASAVVTGMARKDYVCYDCKGDDGERYDRAKRAIDYINATRPLKFSLYRGLHHEPWAQLKAFKVGQEFSESLTSWTKDKSLAETFSHQMFNPKERPGVVLVLEASKAKGINVSKYATRDTLMQAEEWLTSGRYRVTEIKGNTVKVTRVGPAVSTNLMKFDPSQPRVPKGEPEGGRWVAQYSPREKQWLKEAKAKQKAAKLPPGVRYDYGPEDTPITEDEARGMLTALGHFQQQTAKDHGFKYGSIYGFVLGEGEFMPVPPAPPPIELMEMKQCFSNATMMALMNEERYRYVEGYLLKPGIPFPILHAWLWDVEQSQVVDPTMGWQPNSQYIGVKFEHDFLRRQILKSGVYGILDTGMGPTDLVLGNEPGFTYKS